MSSSNPSFKEFGEIVERSSPIKFKEFGELIDKPPTVSEKATQRFRPGAGGKALLRGLSKAAMAVPEMGPLGAIAPRGPITRSQQEQQLEQLLGDPEAGFAEKAIERGAEIAPYLAGGEAGLLPKLGRTALTALAGQTAEEFGLGELAQTGAEIAAMGLPGFRKKIVPTKSQEEVVKMLRRRGLTEEQIAPLIPSERKSALLSKIGARGYRTRKAAQRTKDALGDLYSQINLEGEKLPILSSNRASSLQSELMSKLEKLPSSIRKTAEKDLNELFRKPVKASDLINFWQDINSQINWKSLKGGKKRLNSLKTPLLEGIKDVSPELARDFELTNKQYSKFNNLYKNLQPQSLDRWMTLGETGAFFYSLMKYGPKGAASVVGTDVARRIASEMLINPHLQNLMKQMGKALQQNKVGIAKKIQDKMVKELKKEGIDLSFPQDNNNT